MKQVHTKFRKLLLAAALLAVGGSLHAQLPVTRSVFTGTYTPLVGGTTSTAAGDDAYEQNIPIGFSFSYLGTPYTQFSVSTNGWMSFANGATYDAYSPDLYSTSTNGVLAPWWDDLASSSITYLTTGTPGSQVCTIEWTSLTYYTTSTRTVNYQVKLYEGTNVIEFWYGAAPTGTLNTSESACIGIKSMTGGNGEYLDAVTGSAFTGNSSLQSDRWPAYNFRFTPGAPAPIAAGTYNVGVGQTYINLNEAAADVNHRGVSGAVVFNLVDAQYDGTPANGSNLFPVLIGPVAGTSAANTVTFTKIGTAAIVSYGGASGSNGAIANQASATALGSNVDPIIALVGADYITINNLDLRGNVGNQLVDHAIGVYNSSATDGATNNTFSNITATMNRGNTGSRGFVSNVITTPTSAAGANSFNTYKDFTIKSVYAGIQMTGNASFPDLGNMITRTNCATYNTIGDPATSNDIGNGTSQTYGIRMANQSGFTVANNSIRNVSGSAVQTDGIFIELFQGTCSVNNNKVQTIRNYSTSSTTAVAGIRMSHATTGTNTLRVYNNAVSEITSAYTGSASASRTLKGIYVSGTGGSSSQVYEIFDNSVSMNGGGSPNLSSTCYEIATASGPAFMLGNNVFANFTPAQTGVSRHYCMYSTSATNFGSAGTTSNNNDLYIANDAGVSGFTVLGNTTTYTAVSDWTTASGYDAASVAFDPAFISNTSDLHASALLLNGAGLVPPVYITADLDCAARTPDNDIGAYQLVACSGMPTAGSITGVTAVCSGSGTTLTLTGASTGAGISYQWASSTTSGGPYSTLLGTSLTQATGPVTVPTYYVVGVACSVSSQATVTAEYSVLVNPLPTVAVTPTSGNICLPGGSPVTLTASGATTYSWGPAAGLSATTGSSVTASPTVTTTYTVTGTDGIGCTNTATSAISVGNQPAIVSITATPPSVCAGGNSQLNVSSMVGGPVNTYSFAASTGATLDPMTGATSLIGTGDDDTPTAAPTAIGFTFPYNGATYTQFSVSPDGWILLGSATAANQFTNSVTSTTNMPKIFPYWDDLATGTTGGVTSVVTGSAPNRILKVQWFVTSPRNTSGPANATFQAWLYETSGVIEFRYGSMAASGSASVGVNGSATNYQSVTVSTNTSSISTPNDAVSAAPVSGQMYTFTPPAPSVFAWTPATFLSSTTISNPMANGVTATTTYTVTATAGACSTNGTVTITAGAPLTSTASISPSSTVCENTAVTLNATPIGGGAPYSYAWAGPNSFTSTSQNPVLSSVTVADAGSYTVIITDNCTQSNTVIVTLAVNPAPAVTSTPTAATYCIPGSPVTLNASGAVSYTWAPATGLSATTGATVDASPATSTTYTLTGTGANGCTTDVAIAITAAPAITTVATANPAAVCAGTNSSVISAASTFALTYCQPTYSTGTTFGDYISGVSLNTLTNATGASSSPYYTLYPASGNTTTTLVAGNTYTITLSAGTYTSNDIAVFVDYNQNGILNDAGEKLGETDNMGATPATTSFTFTVPAGAYNGLVRMRVREMDHGGTNDMDPCAVQSSYGEVEDYDITITGGVDPASYVWSPATFLNMTTGASVTATDASATTTYSVTATSVAGCSSTSSATLTVNPLPVVTLSGNTTICAGDSTMLSGSSGGNSQWYLNGVAIPGATSSSYYATAAGVYNMTKTNLNGCADSAATGLTVMVNAAPAVTANATASAVCSGSDVTFTGSGATSYTWSAGVTDGVPFAVTTTGYYVVTGTDGNGCSAMDSVMVTANALPVVALGNDSIVCGASLDLDAGNAGSTYMWNDNSTSQMLTVTASGTYYVDVTDGNGCMSSDTIAVVINTPPVVALGNDGSFCGMAALDAGNPGSTYMWNDNSTSQMLNATVSGTYYVDVTDANGCMSSDTIVVTINAAPVVALGADTAQCGGSVMLDAGNPGESFLWNDNSTSQTLTVSASGTYFVDVTNSSGCTTRDSIDVTINALPLVDLGNDVVQCGGPVTLDAGTSGDTYLWSDNSSNQTLVVSANGTYYVDVTNSATGCASSDTINVTINTPPTVTFTTQSTACTTDPAITLTGSPAGGTFSGPGVTGSTFNPATAGVGAQTLTYDYTDVNGCSAQATSVITVSACVGIVENSLPVANVYPNPNTGLFTIDLGYVPAAPVQVEITNSLGQVVQIFTMTGNVKQVDLGIYEGGVYSVRITDGNTVSVIRVVKQ